MMWDGGGPSIGMAVKNMTALLTDLLEPEDEQYPLQFKRVHKWELRHVRT
ncbi:hypothetical protein GMLC_17910 [Geomonas limicola]|uniref:Uncharacterized protein n=1 Tax=Geomonas limicola TaxID=2740186 RepID=A0A6V8N6K0_9BACT|nr:hypothetical protein GMLC_17910 [Geomonas limicola]